MTDGEAEFEEQLTSSSPSGRLQSAGLQEEESGETEPDCPEERLLNTGPGGQVPSPTCGGDTEVEEKLALLAAVALAPPGGCDCESSSCLAVRWMERSLQSPDLQLQFPDLQLQSPDLQLQSPDLQLQSPDLQLQFPDLQLQSPDLQLQSPDLQLQFPDLQLQFPDLQLQFPDLQLQFPDLQLQSLDLQLQLFLSKADDLQDSLVHGPGPAEGEALAAAVTSFLFTCQPYFNHLQRMQLLDFSQQLCDRLEQLVLTYASYNLLSLDETEPNSLSYFCIGQRELGLLRVTAFRYCRPTPYLARIHTGLFKRMRWTVERLGDEQQSDEEHYFLCYEDIPNPHTDAGEDCQSSVVRMWSIGQWEQVTPDTDDIYDWILCEVPQGGYQRLLFLGGTEPSGTDATDCLQQLLLQQTE